MQENIDEMTSLKLAADANLKKKVTAPRVSSIHWKTITSSTGLDSPYPVGFFSGSERPESHSRSE